MDKVKILSAIVNEQLNLIESIKASIERYKHESDLDEDQTLDPEDYARQNEAKDMQLRYEKMLKSAMHNLKILENAKSETHKEIETGSLIETNECFIFVGLSVPVFKFEGKDVISVSEDAPVFKNLKAKKIGDTIEFGKNSFIILEFL